MLLSSCTSIACSPQGAPLCCWLGFSPWFIIQHALHGRSVLRPSPAKTTVHTVSCALQVAAAHDFVLLVNWVRPVNITHFIMPVLFDWTMPANGTLPSDLLTRDAEPGNSAYAEVRQLAGRQQRPAPRD